jgi:tetratricopeptide (TPR) repeat protein
MKPLLLQSLLLAGFVAGVPALATRLRALAASSQQAANPTRRLGFSEQADVPAGPARIRSQLALTEELIAANKQTEAIAGLLALINTDIFDPQGFYNVGNALVRLGSLDAAVSAYRKAIEQRKGHYSRALNNLGVVLLRAGRWDEAYDALLSAVKLESFHYAEGSYNLGRLYAARGETDLAMREWKRALTVDPKHTLAALALAGKESGDTERVEHFSDGSSVGEKPNSQGLLPRETSRNSASNGALRSREKPAELVVDPVSYNFLQRARTLSEQGKLLDAARDYQRVIARFNGYLPPANLELGTLLLNLKRNDEALAHFQRVMNRDGQVYPISYYYAARLYEKRGELESAEKLFVMAANAYKSRNPSILLDVSRVLERRGDYSGAVMALEEYLRLMADRGFKPSWATDSLKVLREKAGK